jgi:protein-S-isoprenylcysteine O-methyltransferase Ste14
MKWKWANVPIPAQHVVGLILGAILQFLLQHQLFAASWIGLATGFPLVLIGVGLWVWSTLKVGEMEIMRPTDLITSGPFSLSRNPMYVGWTIMYLGIGLTANSVWILVLLPLVAALTHFVDVLKEERFLEKEFGDEYAQYKERVRRYL